MTRKNVTFNLANNTIIYTFSKEEYDRRQIDSVLKQRLNNKITIEEWRKVYEELWIYKSKEMVVHVKSLKNTTLT